MLGVADHILHVREGSFCLYFMTVLVFFFFSVELPLLASVVMVIIIIIIMVSCSQISKLCIIYFIPPPSLF